MTIIENKYALENELRNMLPDIKKIALDILITSGFAMGAGKIVLKTKDGTCAVSAKALKTALDGNVDLYSIRNATVCPISSKEAWDNPSIS